MEKIEIISLSPVDFQRILKESIKEAISEFKEAQKAPSDWEELTLEKAALELHCSIRTIRRRMKELKIKGFRVGREITLQRKDLKKIHSASEKQES